MRVEGLGDVEEAVSFLVEQFAVHETILSALRVNPSDELRQLLRDVVSDCVGRGGASRAARSESGQLIGLSLATANGSLEKQLDRLYSYAFDDRQLRIVVSFAQTLFNRFDMTFHLSEEQLRRPLFLALLCVHSSYWRSGVGRQLLQATLAVGKELGCDGAFGLASNTQANRLFAPFLSRSAQTVMYNSYKGEFREPPIVPADPKQTGIVLRTGRF